MTNFQESGRMWLQFYFEYYASICMKGLTKTTTSCSNVCRKAENRNLPNKQKILTTSLKHTTVSLKVCDIFITNRIILCLNLCRLHVSGKSYSSVNVQKFKTLYRKWFWRSFCKGTKTAPKKIYEQR
jgi:hypothetical protein